MKAICYYRVSTKRQGASGLGLLAQRETVSRHLAGVMPLAEYQEVESGRKSNRVELRKALAHCRRTNATLVIAKLDRLARSAHFLLTVLNSGIEVIFCDLPQVNGPQGKFLLTSMAAVAELEAGLISQRTRDALAACKARGQRLGARPGASPLSAYLREHGNKAGLQGKARAAKRRAEPWRDTLSELMAEGLSFNAVARTLNSRGERTPHGNSWSAMAVSRMAKRLGLTRAKEAA